MHLLANFAFLLTAMHCAFLQFTPKPKYTPKPIANMSFHNLHPLSGIVFLKWVQSDVSHALYVTMPICTMLYVSQKDSAGTLILCIKNSSAVTYQDFGTKGMVHNRLVTNQTLWHIGYVMQTLSETIRNSECVLSFRSLKTHLFSH